MNNVTYKDVIELVDAMVKIALENEREAIAKICETHELPDLAKVIRDRNK